MKIDIKKRYVYFLIGLLGIVGLGFVIAVTNPNPGHPIEQMGTGDCVEGQVPMIDAIGEWECGDAGGAFTEDANYVFYNGDKNVGIGMLTPGASLSFGMSHVSGRNEYPHPSDTGVRNDVISVYECCESNDYQHKYGFGVHDGTLEVYTPLNHEGGVQIGKRSSSGAFMSQLFIDMDGQVGIGTTDPEALLHVGDSIVGSPVGSVERIRIGSKKHMYWRINAADTGTHAGLDISYYDNAPIMTLLTPGVSGGGKVGIGTTNPGSALTIGGTGDIYVSNSQRGIILKDGYGVCKRIGLNSGSDSLDFETVSCPSS